MLYEFGKMIRGDPCTFNNFFGRQPWYSLLRITRFNSLSRLALPDKQAADGSQHARAQQCHDDRLERFPQPDG
jgi:hypothetical protein